MKKKLLFIVLLASLCITAQTQIELNVAFPTGDTADNVKIGGDFKVNYMFPVTDELKVGPSLGLSFFLEETIKDAFGIDSERDGFFYLPLTARGEYTFSEMFVGGLHLGYAVFVGEDGAGEGGLYYRPTLGYLITEKISVNVSYTGINQDGGTFSHFGVGLSFSK